MKERAGKEAADFWLLDWLGQRVVRWAEHAYIGLAAAASATDTALYRRLHREPVTFAISASPDTCCPIPGVLQRRANGEVIR